MPEFSEAQTGRKNELLKHIFPNTSPLQHNLPSPKLDKIQSSKVWGTWIRSRNLQWRESVQGKN